MSKFLDYYHLLNIPEEKRHNNGIGQPATLIPPHELRQAYKRALLHHHPDKQKKKKTQESTSSPTTYPPAAATIDEITEAYRVLGNASERAKYDVELQKWKTMNNNIHHHNNQHQADVIITTRHTGIEIVDLEDLDFEVGGLENEKDATATATATATGIWKRACRCGSIPAFVVTEAELEKSADEGELVTGCKGCSLWLKVMFTVDDDD